MEKPFRGKVVKSGNGAVITFRKKHIGETVLIYLEKDIRGDNDASIQDKKEDR